MMRWHRPVWLLGVSTAIAVWALGVPDPAQNSLGPRPAYSEGVQKDAASEVVTCGESAYQLFKVMDGRRGITWGQAEGAAPSLRYHGRRGRLAVIPSMAVHGCIAAKLVPLAQDEPWIGLRYWCSMRMLQWSTGEVRPHSKPAPWSVPWTRRPASSRCTMDYMGVYYSNQKRWQASEQNKRYRYMIVEFPLGDRSSQSSKTDRPLGEER